MKAIIDMRRLYTVTNVCFFPYVGLTILLLCVAGLGVAKAGDKDSQPVLLSEYPLLSQKDPANYRDQSLLTVKDTLPGGAGAEAVPNLACAATVYTMLDRGRGNSQAMIDDFYADPRKSNGNGPGAKRPNYVGLDVPLDLQAVSASLDSRQPVVLHGFGGVLKEHFVLAVGYRVGPEGNPIVIALDPYPGNSDKPGKQVELAFDASSMSLTHPLYKSIVFRQMRMVTAVANANQPASTPGSEGETITAPVPYKTYTFTPGKLTGQEVFLEKEKLRCKIFCFDQYHSFPKPTATVSVKISLRGGYRAHDIFGHDDFEPKEARGVASGWVPLANGNFIIFPDESKEHLPTWIAERTRLIRVPLVKQYGDVVVNAYDLALALDRFNTGDAKSIAVEFKIADATDDSGKHGKRLIPTSPLADGVYYAYSLPDDRDTANYGFLFAVGTPASGSGLLQSSSGATAGEANMCLLPDVQLAREALDYALLSQAAYDNRSVPNWETEDDGNCPITGLKCYQDIGFTGFHVQLYRRDKTFAIVFRGTEITDSGDIANDILNFFDVVSKQYAEAVEYVQQVTNKAGSDYKIILTGHSLGGGLASFAALYCGQQAIVFNAAGLGAGLRKILPEDGLAKQMQLVRNIDLDGDPVSALGKQVGIVYKESVPIALIGKDGFIDGRTQAAVTLAALDPSVLGPPVPKALNLLSYHSIDTIVDVLKIAAK